MAQCHSIDTKRRSVRFGSELGSIFPLQVSQSGDSFGLQVLLQQLTHKSSEQPELKRNGKLYARETNVIQKYQIRNTKYSTC